MKTLTATGNEAVTKMTIKSQPTRYNLDQTPSTLISMHFSIPTAIIAPPSIHHFLLATPMLAGKVHQ